ncbi:hypothetical protein [Crocinitomix catalasitica]|uniref:hypothetical protein n=1 Tax=Crocinitomix catalasitica TaxID=184607 RepID=UPI000487DE29|nr:hypothetical protein [Crocinitomix catalasitica]
MSVYGQKKSDVYSVFFADNTALDLKALSNFSEENYKVYSLEENEKNEFRNVVGNELGIDERGLYLEKNRLLNISREEIRENSKYSIRNGYLLGVLPSDSVQVALDGEFYYFLMPVKTYLYDATIPDNKLYEGLNPGEYLILSKEDNGYYSANSIKISAGSLEIKELDLDNDAINLRKINNKKTKIDKIPTYILSPKTDEWKEILKCFITYDVYVLK